MKYDGTRGRVFVYRNRWDDKWQKKTEDFIYLKKWFKMQG